MYEYKSVNDDITENYFQKIIFTKFDVDSDLIDDQPLPNELIINNDQNQKLESLIKNIQEASSSNNDHDIKLNILAFNKCINNQSYPPSFNSQVSTIIPILIDQLYRENPLDKIKLYSIQCLHKIMFNSVEIEYLAIQKNVIKPIQQILMNQISPITEHALCILINIFSNHNDFIPYLIDYFEPSLFLNFFTETKFEVGNAKLVTIPIRKKITQNMIGQLFLQFSTIALNEKYFQIILDYFNFLTFQEIDFEDENCYSPVFQGIFGIYTLFTNNRIENEYLQTKAPSFFCKILEALNFYQKSNRFEMMVKFIQLFIHLIHFFPDSNYQQKISLEIAKIILETCPISEKMNPEEHQKLELASLDFLNAIIEKKFIFFEGSEIEFEMNIINFLFYLIEFDSFEVLCKAFSILSSIFAIDLNIERFSYILNDKIFQSIFKVIQCDDQNLINGAIHSILEIYDKSSAAGMLPQFNELFLNNDFNIIEFIESNVINVPNEIMHKLHAVIKSDPI